MGHEEALEKDLEKKAARRERRGKWKMKVSGRSALKLKELIKKRAQD